MLKRIAAMVVSAIMSLSAIGFAEAYRIDDRNSEQEKSIVSSRNVFCDDFTDCATGVSPAGYKITNTHAGTVTVEEYEVKLENGKTVKKNCLVLDDNVPDSVGSKKFAGPGFVRSFKETSGNYAFEIRFMYIEESNPYSSIDIYTKKGNTNITRLLEGSSTGVIGTYSSVGESASVGKVEPGIWYTFRHIVNLKENSYQLKVTAKEIGLERIYTELSFFDSNSNNAESVNAVDCSLAVFDGKLVIDYIMVEKSPVFYDASLLGFEHPGILIQPPVVSAPKMRPVPGRINLCVNGEYLYPATPLYMENGRTMIYIKNFAGIFGCKYTEDGVIEINGEKLNYQENSIVKEGKIFIPLRDAAVHAGYDVNWDQQTNSVILNGNEI